VHGAAAHDDARPQFRDHDSGVEPPAVGAPEQPEERALDHRLRDGAVAEQQQGQSHHGEPLGGIQAVEVGRQR